MHEVQRVFDLVRDAGRQRAHGRQLRLHRELLHQPLPFEQRADARAQQHRVERLEQVVLRAHFDRAHHAVDLVQRGDDDHRHRPHALVPPHPFQHLKAVHHRHHDVEQHEVEGLRGDAVERDLAVRRLLDGVPLALQPAAEDVAVGGVVVHDQHARAGRLRPRLDRRASRAAAGAGAAPNIASSASRGMRDPVEVGDPLGRRGELRVVAHVLDAVLDALHARLYLLAQRVDLGALHGLAVRERRVDVGERAAGGRVNLAQRLQRGVVPRFGGVFDEHLRVAENVVHGRAEVMAQLGEGRVLDGLG